ncbi:MAG: ribosome maturation factor RimM [Rickettsiales bacterium]|jgi:16S rRNA processing protein RimM|nr:ribosome maturation factor RimM [Rickettsiales bacterium]
MPDANKIFVGKIVAAQGLRGEVRVQTYTQTPLDFAKLKIESEKLKDRDIKFIRLASPHSTVVIMKIDGVDDRNASEILRGVELFVDRASLPRLSDGEYYQTDLIGMRVGGNVVAAVYNFGAGDILELDNGEMASFANAKVDLEKNEITLQK